MKTGMPTGLPQHKLGRRGKQLRAAVLSAALELVDQHGVAGFSIAAVAKHAGVHETSIYRRWRVKHALLLDALHEHSDRVLAAPETGSLEGDVIVFLTNLAGFLASAEGRAVTRIAAEYSDGASASDTENFWHRRSRVLAEIFYRHVADEELATRNVDVPLLYQMLIAPIHMRILLTGEPIDERFLTAVTNIVLASPSIREH